MARHLSFRVSTGVEEATSSAAVPNYLNADEMLKIGPDVVQLTCPLGQGSILLPQKRMGELSNKLIYHNINIQKINFSTNGDYIPRLLTIPRS